ncbi:MAG TPA: class I SAM-dependent methyltransferase [Vicinamibacteria bacterium]|nr:class I SAM-dependent methyltransferase [Vicinamibacteria bacterium]
MEQRVNRERLAREIAFHERIAARAEVVWNWSTPAGRRRAERRADLLIRATGLAPAKRALELGCGTGIFLEHAAATEARIVALDISLPLLDKARRRLAAYPRVRLVRGDAEHMPYPDGTFDAVYGSSVLHHIDLDRTLREVFRVLRPGGVAAFAEPNLLNPQVAFMMKVTAVKPWFGVSPDEMAVTRFRAKRALETAGYVESSVQLFDFLHPQVPAALVPAVARMSLVLERLPLVREISGSFLLAGRKPGGPGRERST